MSIEATVEHPAPFTGTWDTDKTKLADPPGASATFVAGPPSSTSLNGSFVPAPAPPAPDGP